MTSKASSARAYLLVAILAAVLVCCTVATCPYGAAMGQVDLSEDVPTHRSLLGTGWEDKVSKLDVNAVKKDLKKVLYDSKDFWPADFGYYGGLFVRLAWHCAGSYRKFDGRGGCDGGRNRFDPELSWPDNANLDKARQLLEPVKKKYGDALSWGDLMILAGNTAIETAGGPKLGFCAGRVDDVDGKASLELGPNKEQQLIIPCEDNGACLPPLGPTTLGLIYVNPGGPKGNPVPKLSAPQIRATFGSMGMNDSETVALTGGGHALGKAHGACKEGAGKCGSGSMKGKGVNAFTSGFEGSWTGTPTKWSNGWFTNLLTHEWVLFESPAGNKQWRPKSGNDKIFMLTADLAFLHDDKYLELVKYYAKEPKEMNNDFAAAWYKLTTRDMGPRTRCLNHDAPPSQPWQCDVPKAPKKLPDFNKVAKDIKAALTTSSASKGLSGDKVNGKFYYGALFSALTWGCASSFRATDYKGGCNGARIRFSPQKDFPSNVGLDQVIKLLQPIKKKYDTLTYADLIVLAGTVAISEASGKDVEFCGGRGDASSGCGENEPAPRRYPSYKASVIDNPKVMGLTAGEYVALQARPRSPTQMKWLGYSGSWTKDPSTLSNTFFKVLLSEEWKKTKSTKGKVEYKAKGKDLYMLPEDVELVAQYKDIVKGYAADNGKFVAVFVKAWKQLVNADRYTGPVSNECGSS